VLRAASTDEFFVDNGRRLVHKYVEDLFVELSSRVQAGADALSRLADNPYPHAESEEFRDLIVAYTAGRSPTSEGHQSQTEDSQST
jgi:hypothetical protein